MSDRYAPMDPPEAERQFAAMLEEAGLPRFDSTFHDPAINELQLIWDHGFSLHIDLNRRDLDPIDDWERAAILGQPPGADDPEPIHVGTLTLGGRHDPEARTAATGRDHLRGVAGTLA